MSKILSLSRTWLIKKMKRNLTGKKEVIKLISNHKMTTRRKIMTIIRHLHSIFKKWMNKGNSKNIIEKSISMTWHRSLKELFANRSRKMLPMIWSEGRLKEKIMMISSMILSKLINLETKSKGWTKALAQMERKWLASKQYMIRIWTILMWINWMQNI